MIYVERIQGTNHDSVTCVYRIRACIDICSFLLCSYTWSISNTHRLVSSYTHLCLQNNTVMFFTIYRVMLRRARLCHSILSVCLSVCLSVRLSVTLRYVFHTGWNTSKIISRPNSLRPLLGLTSTWAIWCNDNTHKIRVK